MCPDSITLAAAESPLLLDVSEVARLLCISRTTLFSRLSSGRMLRPVLREGRLLRWSRVELEAWIAAGMPHQDRWQPAGSSRKR